MPVDISGRLSKRDGLLQSTLLAIWPRLGGTPALGVAALGASLRLSPRAHAPVSSPLSPRVSLAPAPPPPRPQPSAGGCSPAAVRRQVWPPPSRAAHNPNGPEGFAFLRVARGKLQPPAMMRVRVSEDQNSHGIRRAVFKLALEGFDRPHLSTTRRAIPAANQRQVQYDVDGVLLYCLLHPLARAFEGNYLVADLYQQTLERPCASFTKTLISSPLSSIYGAPRLRAVTQSISDRQVRFAAVLHVRLTAARQTRGFAPAQRHATSHREGR